MISNKQMQDRLSTMKDDDLALFIAEKWYDLQHMEGTPQVIAERWHSLAVKERSRRGNI